ncbi:MAG: circadian clock protein KaiA [Cyanothece sp. SIO2G6]|nr:circadian clock protein KaiA [Cyanothece sp. SIO2G6]
MTVCTFTITPSLLSPLSHQLQQGNFLVHAFHDSAAFTHFVWETGHHIDCLVIEEHREITKILQSFKTNNILLPTVLLSQITDGQEAPTPDDDASLPGKHSSTGSSKQTSHSFNVEKTLYHTALYPLSLQEIAYLSSSIEQAIDAFLQLSPPSVPPPSSPENIQKASYVQSAALNLIDKQQRLATKLQERLGYLGVFYKRNPNSFLRRMAPEERQTFLTTLKGEYRDIILNYFSEQTDLNQKIDRYVTSAFLADVPTAQIVKIHMELMDEFSKQLKLEGRNEEILLDYRLTLIDTIANLCELYRRSVPRSQ